MVEREKNGNKLILDIKINNGLSSYLNENVIIAEKFKKKIFLYLFCSSSVNKLKILFSFYQ